MKVSYGDFELDTESISQKGVAYLLQYGLTQSLSDVIAGKAKKLKDDGLDDEAIESALHTAQQTRFEAIVNGEVGQGRSGPRAKGLDKVMFEVAEEALKVAFSAAKKPWPTGKGSAAQINNLAARYIEKYESKVRAEAERRMAAQGDGSALLDELLA
jgi:aspartyl-tRNA synthetase